MSWRLGTYYDRTGIIARGIIIFFIGAMAFTVGLLVWSTDDAKTMVG